MWYDFYQNVKIEEVDKDLISISICVDTDKEKVLLEDIYSNVSKEMHDSISIHTDNNLSHVNFIIKHNP